jgi:hypothetical protein
VEKARLKVSFNGDVIVYVLHPTGSKFRPTTHNTKGIVYRTHEINMFDVGTLEDSVRRLFAFENVER